MLIISSPSLGEKKLGVEIEKYCFLVMPKTELVASKEIIASYRFPSSTKLLGGEEEKVSICFLILNSSVSCGFVSVCSINV